MKYSTEPGSGKGISSMYHVHFRCPDCWEVWSVWCMIEEGDDPENQVSYCDDCGSDELVSASGYEEVEENDPLDLA